jgi:hypothetical protein
MGPRDEHLPAPDPSRGRPLREPDTSLDETQGVPRIVVARTSPVAVEPAVRIPKLAAMLLPSERITFDSQPHPIVFAAPLAEFAVIAVAVALALTAHTHAVLGGQRIDIVWDRDPSRWLIFGAGALAGVHAVRNLIRAAGRYLGTRIVTTNRRAFFIDGVIRRHVKPLGNTEMAGATLVQGPLGRRLDYGDILLASRRLRAMRSPLHLYREFQAVANGVDGDEWKPAVRQTIIP